MPDPKPYHCLLHYDPTILEGIVWIGSGRALNPACGQPEHIGATPRMELVECLKCRAAIETESVANF